MSHLRSVPTGDVSPGRSASLPDLLRRSACGDEDAFARLYDETASRVFGLVQRIVRDPAQSEEVTQEVFLQVWRTASRYEESRGSALSWLMTLAHRRAVDRVRAGEATGRQDTSYHQESRLGSHPDGHDTTAEAAETSIEADRVRAAMAQLTDAQREALELAYFGGYTHTEVAALLDLPLGTAKTRIRDGLIRLRDAMGVTR